MGVYMSQIITGINIIPEYIEVCEHGSIVHWQIWVYDAGMYRAVYHNGCMSVSCEIPPGILRGLGPILNTIMVQIDPIAHCVIETSLDPIPPNKKAHRVEA